MQNIDFYSGKTNTPPQYLYNNDPDFMSTISKMSDRDHAKSHSRANRLLAVILSLCIISFTVGLLIGLKYTGGLNKEIVDPGTKQAVSQLGEKVNNFIDRNNQSEQEIKNDSVNDNTITESVVSSENTEKQQVTEKSETKQNQDITKTFPKNDFPFVLQIDGRYTLRQSKDIASYLSKKGNTVLISKTSDQYNIYVGPFKNEDLAKNSLQKLMQYSDNNWYKNVLLVKR
ncbi:MAG: SPOR domain-containing protein [Spirochaetes bacterium]|nr:SPOR domain-containing protein [Spirochaetota bacterium]